MARTLVLVRHAKAQTREEGLADDRRALTKAGLRSCRRSMARVAILLEDALVDGQGVPLGQGGGLAIWTSPAVRASQTAAALAVAMGLDAEAPEVHESLYAPDAAAFLDEVARASGTVVAVGHNPFLEEVVARLTGEGVILDKASAVAVTFAEGAQGQAPAAAIDWLVQGVSHRRWDALDQLKAGSGSVAVRMAQSACRLVDEPGDPEALHQWRVSLRVARSYLAFIAPYCKAGEARRLAADLKALQSQTSRLREYDVLHATLLQQDAAERYCDAADLLTVLEPVRDAERRRFNKRFARKPARKAVRRSIEALEKPSWRDAVVLRGLEGAEVRRRFDDLSAAYDRDLAACDFADERATHGIRKRSKQRRYVARELAGLLGEGRAESGLAAEGVQETLGRLCDARVNRDIALELLPGSAACAPQGEAPASFAASQQAIVDRMVAELSA